VNRSTRVLIGILGAAVVIYLLFTTVFPWVDRTFVTDPVIDASGPTVVAPDVGLGSVERAAVL
jgi:hypothetical protein